MTRFFLHMRRSPATLLLAAVVVGLAGLAACETAPAEPDSGELDAATPIVVREASTSTPPSGPATQTPATQTPAATPTGAPTPEPVLDTAQGLSILVAPTPPVYPDYDRDEWHPRWRDNDHDCQDTRQEVLIEESTVPVAYATAKQCRVAVGEWHGQYTGLVFTDPGDLDVDHFVPLVNAHRSGGWAWDRERKERYANGLSYDGHLIAVQSSANRAKGGNGPEKWRPDVEAYWCAYATHWVTIKNEWELTATQAEAEALGEMLGTCRPSVMLLVKEGEPLPTLTPSPVKSPAPRPTVAATYASCDEAEAAGVERMRGSNGDGRGFPAFAVPSARDGDGDGVVCER